MNGIRYGFKIGDRWPLCKSCGHLHETPYRKDDDGHWRNEEGQPFEELACKKCEKANLRLAKVLYMECLHDWSNGHVWTIKWRGNRYVMERTDDPSRRLHVFFSEVGGKSKEETLFWVERAASKNGLTVVIPESFEGVEGKLPEKPDADPDPIAA